MIEYRGLVLDDFQEKAVNELENDNSVVVAAPTGCGKTLIAEYLIDHFLQLNQRAVYTAPIKALSNQKYRDFSRLYGDRVGILTGDVSINSNAQILIMTTEIFRNMLFAEKEALEDVKYVIFDEIHYINDIQRGVIWEESVIFALPKMRFLCLSATIPNAHDLTDWIKDIKKHEVVLIEKKERPVPLYQNVYSKNAGLVPVGKFMKSFNKNPNKYRKNFGAKEIVDLVRKLEKNQMFPSICFVFSREGCYKFAKEVAKNFDLITDVERKEIEKNFDEVINKYSLSDIRSVQVLKKLALSGVGVHNAGILPVLKEVVEILFGKGILKILFVTETFAVGVNMPAKAAIFASLEKYDGVEFRYLKNNEFYQMAGRAGRRGIDPKGNVISVVESPFLKFEEIERIFNESLLEPLESQFKLSYNPVLNLIDQYEIPKIREILEMSFAQFLSSNKDRELKEKIEEKKNVVENTQEKIFCGDFDEFQSYASYLRRKYSYTSKINSIKQRIQSGKTGHGAIKKLKGELAGLKQKLNKLDKKVSNIKCFSCKERNSCKVAGSKIKNYAKKIEELEGAVVSNTPGHYDMFVKKYEFLQKTGYITDGKLTYRGKVASRIYGYELMVAELAVEGVFEELTADEINTLCACMVYEINPKKDFEGNIERNDIYYKMKKAKKIVDSIKRFEIKNGIEPSKSIFLDIIPAAWHWTNGGDFKEILILTHLSEGDIIRLFRQVIDLLQQIKRVLGEEQPALKEKLITALDKVNRDIVNVSEYIS
ncbi:MAG: DEAD/DEAH box helicase [Candidatus Muiribacteriota bacterium]